MKTTTPLLALLLLAVATTACWNPADRLDGRGPGNPTPPPQLGLVIGGVPAEPLDLGDGITLEACEPGLAEILCLVRAGGTIGTVQVGRGPIEPAPADPLGWLREDSQAFLETFVADREAACPDRTVTPYGPIEAVVAGEEGVLTGFAVSDGQDLTDLTRSWRLAVGAEVLWVTVNAGSADACVPDEGTVLDPLVLDSLVAPLGEYVAGATIVSSPLPPAGEG